ncbi:MAG: hypothetical protein E7116_07535 [Bacteroidales bacterium]|nr:hypothetical protein [Bacteroidales bacterium]
MKRLFLLSVTLLMALSASAQYVAADYQSPMYMKAKGGRIFLDDEKLTRAEAAACFSDMDGVDCSSDYLRYRGAYNAGVGLTSAGAATAVVGTSIVVAGGVVALIVAPFAAIGGETELPRKVGLVPKLGGYMTLGGLAMLASGIPLICVYKKRIRTLAEEYNSIAANPRVTMSFGGQPSGIGFAIHF